MAIFGSRLVPVTRAARNLLERFRGRFYEGPGVPTRLDDLVLTFAEEHPRATRRRWIEFAIRYGRECYRSGWTRGFEWAERDARPADPEAELEQAREESEQDWDWRGGDPPEPEDLDEAVEDQEGVS